MATLNVAGPSVNFNATASAFDLWLLRGLTIYSSRTRFAGRLNSGVGQQSNVFATPLRHRSPGFASRARIVSLRAGLRGSVSCALSCAANCARCCISHLSAAHRARFAVTWLSAQAVNSLRAGHHLQGLPCRQARTSRTSASTLPATPPDGARRHLSGGSMPVQAGI